jgi:hypothetical protein
MKWLSFFNDDVFGSGVPLPYQPLSLVSHMTFHPRAMLMVVGLSYTSTDTHQDAHQDATDGTDV